MARMSKAAMLQTHALRPGTPVEVRSSFDRRWTRGFRVESVDGGGYRLRRLSDGSVLPTVFSFDVIREDSGR